jgi:hypothetical protein
MLLNIGLARNDGKPDNRPADVLDFLGARVARHAVHQSDTERTLIVETVSAVPGAVLWELCERTAQDCIARVSGGSGELIGPKSELWGAFNPAFFLTLDGNRLN